MIFRALDIETVSDASFWTRGRPRYDLVPCPAGAHSDGSPLVTVREVDVLPPPHACRVVAISCVDVLFDPEHDPRYYFGTCWTDCRWGAGDAADSAEAVLLAAFAHAMETAQTDVHLVTWNGRTFDLPVLAMRSLGHKIRAAWYYKNRDVRYRYSQEGHLDLMDFLCDYGASRYARLDDVARLCGLPGKTDVRGDQVADMCAAALADPSRDQALREKVARYCLQDTLQTALIFLRTRYLMGKVTAETHDAAAATFRDNPDVASALEVDWDRFCIGAKS